MFFFPYITINTRNYKKIILILALILLPPIIHLNETNIRQYSFDEIIILFFFQFIFSIIILIFSLIFYLIYKKIGFLNLLISNLSIYFLQFFFLDIFNLSFFRSLNTIYFLLDNIFVIVIYLLLYSLIILCFVKFNKKTLSFISLVVILNLAVHLISISISFLPNNNNDHQFPRNSEFNLQNIKQIGGKKLIDIYFIIPDSMMSLENAEKNKVINSKEDILQKLSKHNFLYNQNFVANYPTTYASLKTILYGNFPATENSEKYNDRKNFFPLIMKNSENFFFRLINKLQMNFYWIGHQLLPCDLEYVSDHCRFNYNLNYFLINPKHFFNLENMTKNSFFYSLYVGILKHHLNYFNSAYNFLDHDKTQKNKEFLKKNSNFFLINTLQPHAPYNLDKQCNQIQPRRSLKPEDEIKYYSYSYNCVLKRILNFDKKFLDKNKKNFVFIFGDHGHSFIRNNENNDKYIEKLNNVFFAYKTPEECKLISPPKSHVNIMRYIIKCLGNDIDYLDDDQFIMYYENHEDYGKTFKIK
jgi:hypothetical protein